MKKPEIKAATVEQMQTLDYGKITQLRVDHCQELGWGISGLNYKGNIIFNIGGTLDRNCRHALDDYPGKAPREIDVQLGFLWDDYQDALDGAEYIAQYLNKQGDTVEVL